MDRMYSLPSLARRLSSSDDESDQKSSQSSGISGTASQAAKKAGKATQGAPAKIISTGGLVMAVLLSLLLGLAYVVRSLKNVKLILRLKLKRDDRAEKKY